MKINFSGGLSSLPDYDIIVDGVKIARDSIAALCPERVVRRNEDRGRKKQEVHQHGSYFHETVT